MAVQIPHGKTKVRINLISSLMEVVILNSMIFVTSMDTFLLMGVAWLLW